MNTLSKNYSEKFLSTFKMHPTEQFRVSKVEILICPPKISVEEQHRRERMQVSREKINKWMATIKQRMKRRMNIHMTNIKRDREIWNMTREKRMKKVESPKSPAESNKDYPLVESSNNLASDDTGSRICNTECARVPVQTTKTEPQEVPGPDISPEVLSIESSQIKTEPIDEENINKKDQNQNVSTKLKRIFSVLGTYKKSSRNDLAKKKIREVNIREPYQHHEEDTQDVPSAQGDSQPMFGECVTVEGATNHESGYFTSNEMADSDGDETLSITSMETVRIDLTDLRDSFKTWNFVLSKSDDEQSHEVDQINPTSSNENVIQSHETTVERTYSRENNIQSNEAETTDEANPTCSRENEIQPHIPENTNPTFSRDEDVVQTSVTNEDQPMSSVDNMQLSVTSDEHSMSFVDKVQLRNQETPESFVQNGEQRQESSEAEPATLMNEHETQEEENAIVPMPREISEEEPPVQSNKPARAETKRSKTRSKKDNWKCKTCYKVFKTRLSRNKHEQSHKVFNQEPMDTSSDYNNENEVVGCAVCDKTFPSTNQLFVHTLSHILNEAKSCMLCMEKEDHVHEHIDINKDSFDPSAEQDMAASLSRSLIRCRRNKCSVCEELCINSNLLHLHPHFIHKSFKCFMCKKLFPNSAGLQNHLKRAHRENMQYPCKICKKTFCTKGHYNLHLHTHNCQDCINV